MEINTDKIFNEVMEEINTKIEEKNKDIEKKYYCEEEDLLDEVEDDFSYQIKERGEDYYDSGNIVFCCKNNNKYLAKVRGTNDKPYIVNIEITEDGIDYDCTCPCEFPCKHEYAVIMAIANQEYSNIELKQKIKEKKDTLQNVLKQIPAEEIKKYLLSQKGLDYVCFEMNAFEEYFRKYYPNQSYEYYYNNLYNSLAMDDNYDELVESYINKIRQYVFNQEFNEGLKIIIAIFDAYADTDKLNIDDHITTEFPTLGMLLRIINRNGNERTKQNIYAWIKELKDNNYHNNYYLEDIVEMLNFNK